MKKFREEYISFIQGELNQEGSSIDHVDYFWFLPISVFYFTSLFGPKNKEQAKNIIHYYFRPFMFTNLCYNKYCKYKIKEGIHA
jgi:hypothetical protein